MQSMCYGFAALLLTASCANDDTMLEGKQKKSDIPTGTTVFTGTSQPEATTRTAILNHTKGSDASVNWSSTDKIWVKDDGGTWQQSGTVTIPSATNKAEGVFALSGTYTGTTHDVLYTNKSVSGMQPQVEIKAAQTQSAPNNFDHAGESGDCGIATGNKSGSVYAFTLNHKASYLCFIPRSSNPYVNRSKLIKVEIMSDDDIAGTYDIAANGTLTLASGGSKTITVTTGSGFAIDNSADDMSKNATYAVIAPGTHTFRIRYWLRNTTDNPSGAIEGTVSKIVTLNCTAGSIHDITANLDPYNYDGDHYYMWDANKQYWEGHEWNKGGSQPTIPYSSSSDYPTIHDAQRYYHLGGSFDPAFISFKSLPNVNEMVWYAVRGNPCWDKDELWTTMGHLYKGGMWFKKKVYISGFKANSAPDGIDWRTSQNTNSWVASQTLPPATDASKYFYLPALGYYGTAGVLTYLGLYGSYWSSSTSPLYSNHSYYMRVYNSFVLVDHMARDYGMRAQKFSDFGDN